MKKAAKSGENIGENEMKTSCRRKWRKYEAAEILGYRRISRLMKNGEARNNL